MKRVGFFLIVAMLCFSHHDAAAQEFVKPSFDNIVKTLIRMGAIDSERDDVIDLFARVTRCQQYSDSFKDDFVWEKKRHAMREEIRANISMYPVGYAYETVIKLGRYDFDRRLYPFVGEAGQDINVNAFSMTVSDKNFCFQDRIDWLPSLYRLVLDKPVKMDGLYLNEEDGKTLLQRLDAAGNLAHVLFLRVNIRLVFVAALAYGDESSGHQAGAMRREKDKQRAAVLQKRDVGRIQLDGRLDSIEYFEDEARTKLIYVYRPTNSFLQ